MKSKDQLPIIGWREWVSLPDLGIKSIKSKIDTGARSSAIHAFDIRPFFREGKQKVHFKVHPYQKNSSKTITAEAYVIDERKVRNSGGDSELRFVIQTTVKLKGFQWPIELTLTNRDVMGFRMLLGRQAIRKRFLTDPGKSFLLSRRWPPGIPRKTRKK
ncbi:MAG: ATP-dependent zinc protease [bacterium]